MARDLRSPVWIKSAITDANEAIEFWAIWDTGATDTCVTKRVVDDCALTPTGIKPVQTVNETSLSRTFEVDIILPNQVGIKALSVFEVEYLSEGANVLIGMDIISSGNFIVSTYDGETSFSFEIPASAKLHLPIGRL